MGSKYWIKLYHEIIDDPKMGRLSDRLFRRTIEMFLLAGDLDEDGLLPTLQDIAWRLRMNEEELETDMIELQRIGILSVQDGDWIVTKFAERQAPVSGAERVARFRQRKRQERYYGTPQKPDGNVHVTKRYIDTDIDIDTEEEGAPLPTTLKEAMEHPDINTYHDITGYWPSDTDYEYVVDAIRILKKSHEKLDEYLKPYWIDWIGRKTQNGRPYKKTNPAWLQWAINGYTPPGNDEPSVKTGRSGYEAKGYEFRS
jgi:hypothetical protein